LFSGQLSFAAWPGCRFQRNKRSPSQAVSVSRNDCEGPRHGVAEVLPFCRSSANEVQPDCGASHDKGISLSAASRAPRQIQNPAPSRKPAKPELMATAIGVRPDRCRPSRRCVCFTPPRIKTLAIPASLSEIHEHCAAAISAGQEREVHAQGYAQRYPQQCRCIAAPRWGRQFSSILSAAMNASCGISTWPNWRMRFLPRFCFSSSLRFLVMSPP
jgi:hypothetical protein